MKNLFAIFVLTFALSTATFSQEKNLVSGKILIGEKQFDIPKEFASKLVYKIDSAEFTINKKFSYEFKENIIVITDKENKIVAVYLPSNTPQARLRCFSVGWWNSEGGTGWEGFWDCLHNG
jgi:hypothetical protein